MLNKILFLTKEVVNTGYSVCDSRAHSNSFDTLVVVDEECIAKELLQEGYAVLYVSCDDAFVSGIKYITTDIKDCDDEYFNMVFCRQKKLPVTVLETERGIIREITVGDLPALYEMYEDDLIKQWVEPLYDYEEEKLFTEKYIENMYGFYGYGLWLAFDKVTGELMGRVGISIRNINGEDENELGYIIHRKYRGRGLAKELCRAIISYAGEKLGMDRLYIVTQSQNERSERLAKSLEFTFFDEINDGGTNYKIFVKST